MSEIETLHNFEAEMSVLGALLLCNSDNREDSETITNVFALLPDETYFYKSAHKLIYRMIQALFENGEVIDLITVSNALRELPNNKLEEVGNTIYLTELMDFAVTPANVMYHAKILRELKFRRGYLIKAQNLIKSVTEGNLDDIQVHIEDIAKPNSLAEENGIITDDQLDKLKFAPTKWIVPDILPEGLCLFAGKPKMGKSYLALQVSYAVAKGSVVLQRQITTPGEALHLGIEDGREALKERREIMDLASTGGNLFYATEWKNLDQGGVSNLENWIKRHPLTRLIVIDTFVKVMPGRSNRASLYESDYQSVQALQELAKKYRVAIMLIHHMRKMLAEDPLDMISGSTGLIGGVDNVWALVRERGRADATLYVVTRRGLHGDLELALKFDGLTHSWQLLGNADEYRMSQERAQILEVIEDLGGSAGPKEVNEILNKDYSTIARLMHRMSEEGELISKNRKYHLKNVEDDLPFSE